MLNKAETNREIISAHTKDLKRIKRRFLSRFFERLVGHTNLMLIGVYFGILIYFNNQAYSYLAVSSSETVPIFLALTVIQFGLGFLLIATTIKRNGTNR